MFTFSVTGISVAQPAMSESGVPAKPGIGVSLSRPGTSNSFENKNTFIAHLCRNGLAFLLLPFLVTLSMLTDRAGCYNVREKKLIVRKLTSTVNSFGIATFSVRGEGQRFFDFLKCMNTILRRFQMTATVLQHQRLHLCSLLRGGVIYQTRLRIDDIFLSYRFFFLVAKMIFA